MALFIIIDIIEENTVLNNRDLAHRLFAYRNEVLRRTCPLWWVVLSCLYKWCDTYSAFTIQLFLLMGIPT
jgi:hypothetical protein